MAQQRLPMRKIRDVLRLSAAGLSKRQIAASLGIGPTAAGACLRRAREAGVGWPLPDDLDDAALESRLYPVPTTTAKDWRSLPDWPAIHRELRRKGVTLQLVWEEYRAAHPDGYGCSRFCELYRAWEGRSVADDAAGACGRREAVRRLRRHDDRRRRCRDRRGACLPAVCRRARRIELDLRRSDLDADAARLDRLAHTRLWLLSAACRRWSFPTI